MSEQTFKVVIVGGGTAGITVAAQLARKMSPQQIAVIDPAENHYYQPLWTLVGAGVMPKEKTVHTEKSVIPKGVHWIQEAVTSFAPEENYVMTDRQTKVNYEYLVVAPGIKLNWDGIKGLKESIGKNGVVSNYSYDTVDSTWQALQNIKGGNVIFTQPTTPIKCGGAPQKIMYLTEDYLRKHNLRDKVNISFYTPAGKIFPVKKYEDAINEMIERRGIQRKFQYNLIEIIGNEKKAIFENLTTGETETVSYEMIHVTPPMSAPDFIKESPLVDASGLVEVDKHTLQHTRYANIFSLGDVINTGTPTKNGAAVRKQAPVVVANLLNAMKGQPITTQYEGYGSCPLVTGYGRLMLIEFDYSMQPKESFPFNQAKERLSMYLLKRYLLPAMYWKGMLKGRA
ncbi:NAD(P)/FAD-dependent oxidoreductase [Rubeoparvulum massiliense]|uniref:NAD(P)/FAD-dependent oxidoreductase n=1 Tax=Rubeoparvulum massiliense TaxID=1631346 RepID=UPI00065E835A|nr:FAD/NAD(P)-binding oxidoreductase [Rubeoparvulum massiliense]